MSRALPPPPATTPTGLPVARRPGGLLQIGSTPRSATVLGPRVPGAAGVGPAATAGVEPLGLPGRPAGGAGVEARLVADASAWAALDPAGPPPVQRFAARAAAAVAVVGGGRTARLLLQLLDDAGIGTLVTEDPVALPPARARPAAPADLVVLITHHAAHAVRADGLLADGVPHLSVVLRDTDAVVGPLVVPGRSACLRCLDLHVTDADPGWPAVVDAFVHGPGWVEESATARAVAGLAGLQVLAHLDGAGAGAVGATLELLLPEGTVRQRWWSAHPQCGCVDLPLPAGRPGRRS
ncbi:hypothetical protein [Kineococcus sp. SYSU DK006]|uniref:hypothetical protein n=1 Tax=Kineococcus sp. SYSU DK006 TaxID=3383127 RepID=UPI003D7D0D07